MILAVLEAHDGVLKKLSHEILTAAAQADRLLGAGGVCALLIGPGAREAASLVPKSASRLVLCADGADLANYAPQAYALAVQAAVSEVSAQVVLVGASSFGRDLAPRISCALDAGLLMDVTEIFARGQNLAARRPVYAGKAISEVEALNGKAVVAVRPNAFASCAQEGEAAPLRELAVAVDAGAVRAKVRSVRRDAGSRPELSEADIVVAGGRGLKEPGNFTLVEQLADALGAAVGATRAAVDAGWRPHHEQIGQTGRTVSPGLYFAIGVSGAVQHVAGMSSSRTIVAINRDPEAPIFKLCDYGVVGDAMEVLPALIGEVEGLRR